MEKILHERWLPWAIFVLGCLLFGMNLGARDFWTPDEGDFAQIAKEMAQSGDYLVPHLNGKPYSEKPPLFYWSILFFEKLFGAPREFSARLPSVLSAAGGLVLVFWLGKRIYSARAGLVAAAVLATSFRYLWNAAYLQTDMLFSFFCLLALCLFWRAQGNAKSRFFADLLPFYLALAAGILTKGPLAGVIVFLPIFALAIWEKDKELLRRLRLLWGLAVVAALTVWWYVVVGLEAGGGFLRGAIVREHLMRFLDSDSHNQPPHYYLLQVWPNLFPWSIFLPAALAFGWKERRDRGTRFLWLGFVCTFLFLSICSSKQGKYLLPAVPAVALLTAAWFEKSRADGFSRLGMDILGWLFVALGLIGLAVSLLQWLPAPTVSALERQEIDPKFAIGLAPLLHALAGIGFFSLWYRRRSAAFRSFFLAGSVAAVFLVLAHFYSRLNPLKSPRELMERTAARMEAGAELAICGSFRGGYAYYSGHLLTEFEVEGAEEKIEEYFADELPRFLLVEEQHWRRLRERLDGRAAEIDRDRFGSRMMLLLANPPAQAARANSEK